MSVASRAGSLLIATAVALLTACGGGGGDDTVSTTSEREQPAVKGGPARPPKNLWQPANGKTPASGNYVYLQSDADETIGAGRTYLYTDLTANIGFTVNGGLLSVSVRGDERWAGQFEAMSMIPLMTPGYYPNVSKYPLQDTSKGGLDWSGEGRICSGNVNGWFVVDWIAYVNGKPSELDLRFEMHCNQQSSALHGKVHWVATDVPTVRVPTDYPNIAAAIAAAPDGFTVLVEDGVYKGSANKSLNFGGKRLKLRGANGPERVAIDCEGIARFITFDHQEDVRSAVSDLTVRNCSVSFDAAIFMLGSSPLIEGNIFESTLTPLPTFGVTLYGNNASPTVARNVFRNTTCDDQFGTAVVMFGNVSSPYVANNVFIGNQCRAIGMTLPTSAAPVVVNNTMVGNRAGIYVDRRVTSELQWYSNNLIVGNERGIEVVFEFSPPQHALAPFMQNNLIFGNARDVIGSADIVGQYGNIRADPLFVGAPTNLRLSPESPAKDAGASLHAPTDDFDGRPRRGRVDIGAFELQ